MIDHQAALRMTFGQLVEAPDPDAIQARNYFYVSVVTQIPQDAWLAPNP